MQNSLKNLQTRIEEEEHEIFAAFCGRVGIINIQEYEDKQLRLAEEEGAAELKYKTQVTRLEHQ